MILVGVAALALGCGSSVNMDAERRALLDTDRSWAAAIAAGDMDHVFSYWADDAVIYAAGVPAVHGKEAIRRFVATNRDQHGFVLSTVPHEAVVSQAGELGYTIGDYEISIGGPDGSAIITKGRYLATWRKDVAGLWKCVLEIHSPLGGT